MCEPNWLCCDFARPKLAMFRFCTTQIIYVATLCDSSLSRGDGIFIADSPFRTQHEKGTSVRELQGMTCQKAEHWLDDAPSSLLRLMTSSALPVASEWAPLTALRIADCVAPVWNCTTALMYLFLHASPPYSLYTQCAMRSSRTFSTPQNPCITTINRIPVRTATDKTAPHSGVLSELTFCLFSISPQTAKRDPKNWTDDSA